MSTFARRVTIFLIVTVAVSFLFPGLSVEQARAMEPESKQMVFYEIPKKVEAVKYPELPPKPKPEPKPEPAPVVKTYANTQSTSTTLASKKQAPVATTGKIMTVTVTAYSSTPDQTSGNPFITASGSHVHWGTVAANFLPFGTKVKFPDYFGDQVFTIEDRTARKYSNRADIWFPSRGEALQFGKRTLRIEVL